MAGSGRDGQAPAAAGRIALNGSGEGRLRPKLERGARLRADALMLVQGHQKTLSAHWVHFINQNLNTKTSGAASAALFRLC